MVSKLFLLCLPFCLHAYYQEPWGKDSKLVHQEETKGTDHTSIGTKIAGLVIDFHQKVISPVDGPRSHFRPSSSQYMRQAMKNYGFFKGYIMGCDRLLRENSEEWVYRTVEENGAIFKYDPATLDKSIW
jgi:putative component of membrane protein insertase Oxa1/YidC/SpoIIIJ protein YidD